MFAFQPPPPFAEMEQIEIADAKVSDFKPIYFTKKYANPKHNHFIMRIEFYYAPMT